MEDCIFCEFNMFAMKQTIGKIVNSQMEQVATTTMSELPDAIAAACNNNDIYKVKLFGMTEMLLPLAQKIEWNYSTKFSDKEIIVEVN